MTVTPLPLIGRNGGLLPAEPLAEIIRRDIAHAYATRGESEEPEKRCAHPGVQILARITGIGEETLRNFATRGRQNVTLDVADRYLCATGRHLRDVYPWLYTDEQIEADIAASDASIRALRPKPPRRRGYVTVSHGRSCATKRTEGCTCKGRFAAYVWRDGKREHKWFDSREDAAAWVAEWRPNA